MESIRAFAGFTLVELVATMIVVGILAVFVAPRFADLNTFDAVGVADQATSLLRFAQRTAVARRGMVFVNLAVAPPTFCSVAACGGACVTAIPLPGGNYRQPNRVVALAGTTGLCFDPLGRPFSAATGTAFAALNAITVSDEHGVLVRTISIERETGYVH